MKLPYKVMAAGALASVLLLAPMAQAESTGYCVIPAWKEKPQQTVTVRTIDLHTEVTPKIGILPHVNAVKQTQEVKPYTEDELEMLACVIYQEAGGDSASDETRRMVGEVVLNRVTDPRFPGSIEAVLLQKSQYGRFHWTGIVWPSRAKNEPDAVQRAYDCAKAVFTEDRLLPTDTVFQAEFIQGEIVASAPGYYFCR